MGQQSKPDKPEWCKPYREEFLCEAMEKWCVRRLFEDLSKVKKKDFSHKEERLTATEGDYLCLFLTRHSPTKIAQRVDPTGKKKANEVTVYCSSTIYKYVSILTNENIENWRDIPYLLAEKGYKKAKIRLIVEIPESLENSLSFVNEIDLQSFFTLGNSVELPTINSELFKLIAQLNKVQDLDSEASLSEIKNFLQNLQDKLQVIDISHEVKRIEKWEE